MSSFYDTNMDILNTFEYDILIANTSDYNINQTHVDNTYFEKERECVQNTLLNKNIPLKKAATIPLNVVKNLVFESKVNYEQNSMNVRVVHSKFDTSPEYPSNIIDPLLSIFPNGRCFCVNCNEQSYKKKRNKHKNILPTHVFCNDCNYFSRPQLNDIKTEKALFTCDQCDKTLYVLPELHLHFSTLSNNKITSSLFDETQMVISI